MQYGLNLPNGGPSGDPRTLADLARLAEESGWDGVFLEDYVIWQGKSKVPTYDPWVALGAMAMQTERVRLGTMITPLPRRRPWQVARQAATVDHLSGGRLILGVGSGDNTIDTSFTLFGEQTDLKVRARMLDEGLEILKGLWSGKRFSYAGQYYHLDGVTCLPRPVQKPRIPIWVGGGWPLKGPTERALRWDGSCMYIQSRDGHWRDWTPDDVRAFKKLAEKRRLRGTRFDIALGGRHRGANWKKERALIRSLAEAGATWWIEYIPPATPNRVRQAIRRGPLRIDG